MKTLLLHKLTFARVADRLRPFGDRVRPVTMDLEGRFEAPFEGRLLDAPPQPDIAFGSGDVWYAPKVKVFMTTVRDSPRLDWFQSAAAGVEHPNLRAIGRAARLYCTCHEQADAMAEWALWGALDHFRGGPSRRAAQSAHQWRRGVNRELMGSTWLIVGFGSIGAAIGRRVKALGGRVTGVRRSGGTSPAADRIVTRAGAEELGSADVVLLSAPHTPETEGMADAAFFAAMKPDALFMNLGRGALVKEADLLAALDAGRPAAAWLDVVGEEPLPADNPLWTHPKVTITPHDSGVSEGVVARTDALFLDNLDRYLRGAELRHVAPKSWFED
jgi:phosphoglycerate dehydrogenase-like enzyme